MRLYRVEKESASYNNGWDLFTSTEQFFETCKTVH